MTIRANWAARLGLAVLVIATGRAQQPPTAVVAGTAILAGQVIDDTTKRPLSGVVVTLSLGTPSGTGTPPGPAARRASALSNTDGRFVFRDVPAGTFTITTSRAGYAASGSGQVRIAGPTRPVIVADGARVTDMVIRMWRLSAVSGTVRDDRGEPLVGVSVWALRRSMTSGRPELVFGGGTVEATDEQGRFRLAGLAPGNYAIGVMGSTYTNPSSTVRSILGLRSDPNRPGPMPGVTTEGRLSGAIQIERAGVEIDGWQASVGSGSPEPLPGPDGTLLLHPTTFYPGVTDAAAAALIRLDPGVDRHGLDFSVPLIKTTRVSGVLVGPDGPAPRHGIRLISAPTDPTTPVDSRNVASGTTDERGRFVLLGVPPGTYVLDAYRAPMTAAMARMLTAMTGENVQLPANPPPAVHGRLPITVGTTPVDGLELVMLQRAVVSGRVVFDGQAPVPPPPTEKSRVISVALWDVRTTNRIEGVMAADGTFEIRDVPPGRYHVLGETLDRTWRMAAARSADADLVEQVLEVGQESIPNIIVTYTDKPIGLTGSVLDDTGQAATDGSVVLVPANVDAWIAAGIRVQRTKVATIGTDGRYQMTVDLPGDYLVIAVPPEINPQTSFSPITVSDEVARAFASMGIKVSLAPGDNRTQAITMRRPR